MKTLVLCGPGCLRVKLQALPSSHCDGLRMVLEQYFRHAWFFRHAVLKSCLDDLSGSVHAAAAVVAAVEGGEGEEAWASPWRSSWFSHRKGSAAFC